MAIVTKRISGNLYRYDQTSKRVNGKVVTTSLYLGPVTSKRRKNNVGFVVMGLVSLALTKAKGDLQPFKARPERLSAHKRSSLKDTWKPDNLATIQLKASRAAEGKDRVVDKALVKDMKAFSERLHSHSELLKSVAAPSAPAAPSSAPHSESAPAPASAPETASASPQDGVSTSDE